MQTISSSQASPEVPINENFATVTPAKLYGLRQPATSGLTWGFYGGRFNGVAVSDGTVALTASTTNYVVAHRTTGAVTSATTTTNWLNTTTYLQLYSAVTGATTVTSYIDFRQAFGEAVGSASAPDQVVNAQTGTTYNYVTGDKGKLVTHANAAPIAGALPIASTTGASWWVDVQNRGAGTLTITPTTSNIDGSGSLAIAAGQGVRIVSDGTNYFTQRGMAAAGAGATLGAVNVFTKNQSVSPSTLTSGASIALDASLSNNFKITLATNATLANASNPTDGMVLNIRIKQDATGSRTLAYGTAYKWPGGAAGVLSTSANAVDLLSMYYDSADAAWACVLQKGFA